MKDPSHEEKDLSNEEQVPKKKAPSREGQRGKRTAVVVVLLGTDKSSLRRADWLLHHTLAGLDEFPKEERLDIWCLYFRQSLITDNGYKLPGRWKQAWPDNAPRVFQLTPGTDIEPGMTARFDRKDLYYPDAIEHFLKNANRLVRSDAGSEPFEPMNWDQYDHVYTLVSGHGGPPHGILSSRGGLSAGGTAELAQLSIGNLATAMEAAGLRADGKSRMLILHACRLSTLEVACELRNVAGAMLASQDDLRGEMCVDHWLKALANNGSACNLAEQCLALHRDTKHVGGVFAIQELSQIEAVIERLNVLGKGLSGSTGRFDEVEPVITRVRGASRKLGYFVDITDFCERLVDATELPESIRYAAETVGETLRTLWVAGTGDNHRGISVYFPPRGKGYVPPPERFQREAAAWVDFVKVWSDPQRASAFA